MARHCSTSIELRQSKHIYSGRNSQTSRVRRRMQPPALCARNLPTKSPFHSVYSARRLKTFTVVNRSPPQHGNSRHHPRPQMLFRNKPFHALQSRNSRARLGSCCSRKRRPQCIGNPSSNSCGKHIRKGGHFSTPEFRLTLSALRLADDNRRIRPLRVHCKTGQIHFRSTVGG